MSLDTLPRDIMIHEILPKLEMKDLFNIAKIFPNIKYNVINEALRRVKDDIPFRIDTGFLLIDWDQNWLRKHPTFRWVHIHDIITNIHNILDDIIQIQIDNKKYSVTKSGLYGLLLGLLLSNTLSQHIVKLHNIVIDNSNIRFFLYNHSDQTYYIEIKKTRYFFDDLSFISNLNVSDIKPDNNKVYHRHYTVGQPSFFLATYD